MAALLYATEIAVAKRTTKTTRNHASDAIKPDAGDTLANALRRRLGDEILEGRYAAGAQLNEQSIADRFNVSRTPVREALKQLQAAGLVEMRPHRNATVARLDEKRLESMFEAAAEMEIWAARLAAKRMTLIERHRLKHAFEDGAKALGQNDPEAYSRANRSFHQAIIDGAHNEFLVTMSNIVRFPAAPYRKAQFTRPERMQGSHEEHAAILEAISNGLADEASVAMERHLSAAIATVFSQVLKADSPDRARPTI